MTTEKKGIKFVLGKIVDIISGVFVPILFTLCASGILKGVLEILKVVHVLTAEDSTYTLLYNLADCILYFLPVFLAVTSAQVFKTNQFVSILIAVTMVSPNLISALQTDGGASLFGITATSATYTYSVLPIIMAVAFQALIEKFCDKIFPEVVRGIFTPLVSMILVFAATLFVFGPIGTVVGNGMAQIYSYLYHMNPMIAGALLGCLCQPMVLLGLHWGLVPIIMSNLALYGADTIVAIYGPSIFALGGTSLAIAIKTKSNELKEIAYPASISAFCFGSVEPSVFGVALPLKTPFIWVCASGLIGGVAVGVAGNAGLAYIAPSISTIAAFFGQGFKIAVCAYVFSFVFSFAGTMLTYKDNPEKLAALKAAKN